MTRPLEINVKLLNEFYENNGEFWGNNCEENLKIFWLNFENIRNCGKDCKIVRKLRTNFEKGFRIKKNINRYKKF